MRSTILALTTGLLLAVPAAAQDMDRPAMDGTWLTLSGVVVDVEPTWFMLDYGMNTVAVQLDEWNRDTEALRLSIGDEVAVTGKVDDDLFVTTSLQAASVFVEKFNTFFSSEAVDRDNALTALTTTVEPSAIAVHGTVTRIEGNDMIVDSGVREIRVTTDELDYDPFDDEGFQRVGLGDRVIVSGTIDHSFFNEGHLVAGMLVSLEGDDQK